MHDNFLLVKAKRSLEIVVNSFDGKDQALTVKRLWEALSQESGFIPESFALLLPEEILFPFLRDLHLLFGAETLTSYQLLNFIKKGKNTSILITLLLFLILPLLLEKFPELAKALNTDQLLQSFLQFLQDNLSVSGLDISRVNLSLESIKKAIIYNLVENNLDNRFLGYIKELDFLVQEDEINIMREKLEKNNHHLFEEKLLEDKIEKTLTVN